MITYSNPRLHAVIDNWPIGTRRTTATFSVETHPTRGERGTRFTIDPKTGRQSATKVLTYSGQVRIVDGDDGKTYFLELSVWGHVSVMKSNMQFQEETIHPQDGERFLEIKALFTKSLLPA